MYRTRVQLDGMHCPMCEASVKGLVRKIYPNASLNASHKKGLLIIEDAFIPSRVELSRALESGGYEIQEISTEKFVKRPSIFSRLFGSLKSA